MNCDYIADNMAKIVYGKLPREELAECRRHMFDCAECTDAVRGAEALALLRNCGSESVPDGLFDKLSSAFQEPAPAGTPARRRTFWLGSGLGGAIAASFLVAAMTVGWIGPAIPENAHVAQFAVNVSEPTIMNVAIEADRQLVGASISILLSGDLELDGFSGEREVTWIADLEEGINRLQLPVVALDADGGKMIVRLDHPDTEQVYVIEVDTTA
jgi:hypothetical protein